MNELENKISEILNFSQNWNQSPRSLLQRIVCAWISLGLLESPLSFVESRSWLSLIGGEPLPAGRDGAAGHWTEGCGGTSCRRAANRAVTPRGEVWVGELHLHSTHISAADSLHIARHDYFLLVPFLKVYPDKAILTGSENRGSDKGNWCCTGWLTHSLVISDQTFSSQPPLCLPAA